MKLVRYGNEDAERPGLIDANGVLRDLSAHIPDIDGRMLNDASLERLRALDTEALPAVDGSPRFAPIVGNIGKFLCIGLNYSDHAAETGAAIPAHPILFFKANSAIVGANDDVIMPRGSTHTDWEVELGVVIGTTTKYVSEQEALSHVAGYCIVNDVSERHFQTQLTGQWTKGKSCDTFGPTGPFFGDPRRGPRSASVGYVSRCERKAHANRQYLHDDFQRGTNHQSSVSAHDIAPGRYHHHRHASRCWHGDQARSSLPQIR